MRKRWMLVAAIAAVAVAFTRPTAAQEHDLPDSATANKVFPKGGYSTQAGKQYPTRVFFGDTHLHTSASMDAGAFGCRLGPPDAYRFARGEELVSSTGVPVRLSRPLDFLVVADHSDNMGFFPKLFAGDPAYLSDPTGKRWYDMVKAGGQEAVKAALEVISAFSQGTFPRTLACLPGTENYRSAWKTTIEAAEKYNAPGLFTAFIGYEWTSNTGGNNLHRVIVYRDGGDRAVQTDPFTVGKPAGSDNPRDLWKWMDAYQQKTGGRVLAIAHNGNLSNGIMFPLVESFTGKPVDREYATTRARWEPLYEVTQMKGDGETHPVLSPNDEFANFERWDKGNLDLTVPKKPEMLTYEYGRQALQLGLQLEQKLGVNPYKFGMVGSTDAHTALSTADDDNYYGKLPSTEPSPTRAEHVAVQFPGSPIKIMGWEMTASGYAAVWARENTREALFDAMQRRETYATTGPRMIVRFFGGWDYTAADARTRNPAEAGYAKGVPMGGDLKPAGAGKTPTFLVAALKDPIGANLDRIQIVKGWLDAKGGRKEKVFDVVWSGNRKREANGKLEAVGSSVDVGNAVYTNTIGAPELITVWKDPEFNASQRAVYYARVLEIPTPRWTAYDAKRFGVKLPPEVPMVTQERAYTSPIWYTPAR
jgi:hypothetical protein